MEPIYVIVISIVCLALGAFIGFLIRKKVGEAEIGSAEEEAARILEEGKKEAESAKKRSLDRSQRRHYGSAQ